MAGVLARVPVCYSVAVSQREREILAEAGIEVAVLDEIGRHAAVRSECLRAAQRIQRRRCRTIGLLPASAEVSVVGIGVNLAIAMAELSGSTMAYIDANQRWPALAPLLASELSSTVDTTGAHPFETRWLRGDVALLVPHRGAVSGAGLVELEKLLASSNEIFECSLVDLTGWRKLGEHLSAYSLLDGIVVVARADVTTEDQLLRIGHELPEERHLGVLLLGCNNA